MITLVFLICFPSGECVQQGPAKVFESQEQCHAMAELTHSSVRVLIEDGAIEPHVAIHKCIDWGTPT